MILIYPIGIPAMYGVAVYAEREHLSTQEAREEEANGHPNTKHLHFLVVMYKPEFYYFELVECGRRLSLASIIGVVAQSSAAQPALALLISMCFTHLYTEWKPLISQDALDDSEIKKDIGEQHADAEAPQQEEKEEPQGNEAKTIQTYNNNFTVAL